MKARLRVAYLPNKYVGGLEKLTGTLMSTESKQLWLNAEDLRKNGQTGAAVSVYTVLLKDPAWRLPAHLRLAAINLDEGSVRDAVAHAKAAHALREPDPAMNVALCDVLVRAGELRLAIDCLDYPQLPATYDPEIWAELGRIAFEQAMPQHARPLLYRARDLGLRSALLDYFIGQTELYLGNFYDAERMLESSLLLDQDFGPSHRALSKLRKYDSESHHIDRLRRSFSRIGEKHHYAPQLCYSLFKELDDIGERADAWSYLELGMRLRRAQLSYDSRVDKQLFDYLIETPMSEPLESSVHSGPTPIFIVGMPRSGTTLLERILGSHSQVTDAGELSDFVCQLRWMCDRFGGPQLYLDLAMAASEIDLRELGLRYLEHTQWLARGRAFYTDKLPANFINVGYIAKALPNAKILHMTRSPMDVCFSNLKELFANAYPHSYDQIEMADHFLNYKRLMKHWHQTLPGRILDVDYSDLVNSPERVARQIFEYCGLQWEEGVLAIESRQGAVATASSQQVREPIHRRFMEQWQAYAPQLEVMRERLGTECLS